MAFGDQPIDDAFSVVCPYGGCFLTNTGSLIGAIALPGIDPDAMTRADAEIASIVHTNIYAAQAPGISITEYYIHIENQRISLRDRENPVSHKLSKAREAALNARGLAATYLVHFFEFKDPTSANNGFMKTLLTNGLLAPFDADARDLLRARFSAPTALLVRETELRERLNALRTAMAEAASKWSQVMDPAQVLSLEDTWKVMKYLATHDERYLDGGLSLEVPDDDCSAFLVSGDIVPVQVERVDMLKIEGVTPIYVRSVAITRAPKNPVGMWNLGFGPPLHVRGNYVIVTHFSPYSAIERALMFREAKNNLTRSQLNVMKMLSGDKNDEERELHTESYALKRKRLALDQAEGVEDRWGTSFITILLSDRDPDALATTCKAMNSAITGKGMSVVWEAAGLPRSYQSVQPGKAQESVRRMPSTLSRAGAVALVARSSRGHVTVEDLAGEEAEYVYETRDGVAFHHSPYVGQKAFTIGIGPIRSGKTFKKNTTATHQLKYQGFLRSIDIDPGSETVAKFFGDDGGIIRLENDNGVSRMGVNPFASCEGEGDLAFVSHMQMLIQTFLAANETVGLKSLLDFEQRAIDEAILSTMRLRPELRSLTSFVQHLPKETQAKFARFMEGGIYNGLFNAQVDGIGSLDKRVGVFNLQAYRDTPNVLKPMFVEAFYRVTRLFEDKRYLHLPKRLDIDEAHHGLQIPDFREFVLKKTRTWGKFFASINMWSQSPTEFVKLDGWPAIRSAASTLIFMADGQMDRNLYRNGFLLTEGQCDVIADLEPRAEALIIQPEFGIAKRVRINVEPEQYVINTSNPREVALREQLIAEHGLDKGLSLAAQQIAPLPRTAA
ncbi:MAG TPA: hypothetical protein VGU69_10390 [Rhizomicrobium sp.]|nr:hypothetical protein [Rhizomicrobium sp.]